MNSKHIPSSALDDILHPEERQILDAWLKRPNWSPTSRSKPGQILKSWGILPDRVMERSSLSAGVARIVLRSVEERLPQWSTATNEQLLLGRDVGDRSDRLAQKIQFHSRLLFGINWATSAPGLTWPCDYYVTWLPIVDRWVVTASADSDDVWGVCDVAIGSFGSEADFRAEVARVLQADWRGDETGVWRQAWEAYWRIGSIPLEVAVAWREAVWPEAPTPKNWGYK